MKLANLELGDRFYFNDSPGEIYQLLKTADDVPVIFWLVAYVIYTHPPMGDQVTKLE
jgi:hypothetical protein